MKPLIRCAAHLLLWGLGFPVINLSVLWVQKQAGLGSLLKTGWTFNAMLLVMLAWAVWIYWKVVPPTHDAPASALRRAAYALMFLAAAVVVGAGSLFLAYVSTVALYGE